LGNCISGANRRGYVLNRVRGSITSEMRVLVWSTGERGIWITRVLPEGRGSIMALFA
jgi:hypothetical protein